jgi:hypothetical protein
VAASRQLGGTVVVAVAEAWQQWGQLGSSAAAAVAAA